MSNTGAYGNHGPAVVFHRVGESFAVYRAPHKKVDAYSVCTNAVPAGAFRGYGLGQVTFAVESAMDEVARRLGMDPLVFREKNVIGPGEPMHSPIGEEEEEEACSSPRSPRGLLPLGGRGPSRHHAVLSWAEIDADFGDAPVLLATRMDGEALDAAGTQLVVPSDRCGARYVSAVTGIWIGSCRTP
ncbi:molybdopterin cofactor-binding domain-containing protein [Streptomyces stackebrandtii]|uniref:molybdopterin cofactor-binding domain-containing protein n=1 Tax=Streptomyces stackebrandtii TaxID=3051177 RepID=UPI0028DCD7EC|nr:molybdopterin cofactor-binding domain-containing protein [Streptomyces sp. DSM 40976]